ncbi:hypothetical protein KOR42_39450 [Thalassoglobus neptunius]|uniref:Uncharacterized protein n=1 Tax=Thalassoglobus neptunius TaxID=1938619 RepID=A0A5C5WG07_9PLAN|nr:hypothetical protein [Thalassoglobus neptunius]TWT49029.1 hypothetical protein KOR42_39450 [Thalassoglobus neptunius]
MTETKTPEKPAKPKPPKAKAKPPKAKPTGKTAEGPEEAGVPEVEEGQVVKRPRGVSKAGPCPIHPGHTGTVVYRTGKTVRYCKCNTCGHKYQRPITDDAIEAYLSQLATQLEEAPRVDDGSGLEYVVLESSEANGIANDLRRFLVD